MALPVFSASDGGIDGHVRPRFVDDSDHAQRHSHFANLQSVRASPLRQSFANRIGQGRNFAHPLRHLLIRAGVSSRRSRIAPSRPERFHVFAIGVQECFRIRLNGIGHG